MKSFDFIKFLAQIRIENIENNTIKKLLEIALNNKNITKIT